ncbi:hypothetical protein JTE90_001202 [Oedothorax gibbosus]|uniref:Uncharacterized protein n=1 Tax=Oedothorax gibbosus TaxID=931172 RepID=A0AAV6UVM5_9ARAC|nr:hypothetical protein JTE90_001202 [Oedothorax gibbosus]
MQWIVPFQTRPTHALISHQNSNHGRPERANYPPCWNEDVNRLQAPHPIGQQGGRIPNRKRFHLSRGFSPEPPLPLFKFFSR